jgi:purine-binding chemotaxis protein CheW
LRDSRYAVEALAVREIVPLPEIVPLDETPGYVVGVIDLRGQIVPILDLNLRFGRAPQPYRQEDYIVVLESDGIVVGIVVNAVRNVCDIAPEERTPVPAYGNDAPPHAGFLTGLLKADEQVVMLLHLENMLRLPESLIERLDAPEIPASVESHVFCPDASPQERAVFRERAARLAQPLESQEQSHLLPLVVVRLGTEYFGIELPAIREFADLRSVTPVPCCPAHIVGLMNLRGDLITLVEIRSALGLPAERGNTNRKVVVLQSADLGAGVLVDDVLDVIYLPTVERTLTAARTPGREYLTGTAPYGAETMSLLDLPALLRQQILIVNESP